MNMKALLSVAAILAWLFGAALIFAPESFYQPAKIALTPMLATLAQAHGATLVGLGVINWLSRRADRQSLSAVLTGNLVAQILSLGVVVRTMTLGAGPAVAPGILIHVALGGLFAFFLFRMRKIEP